MPHGTTEECTRWHRLDEEMDMKRREQVTELAQIQKLLLTTEAETESLARMCDVARTEFDDPQSGRDACRDVVEHCTRGICDIKRCIASAYQNIESLRYFIADGERAHHDSVVPHLSSEELATIGKFNLFTNSK